VEFEFTSNNLSIIESSQAVQTILATLERQLNSLRLINNLLTILKKFSAIDKLIPYFISSNAFIVLMKLIAKEWFLVTAIFSRTDVTPTVWKNIYALYKKLSLDDMNNSRLYSHFIDNLSIVLDVEHFSQLIDFLPKIHCDDDLKHLLKLVFKCVSEKDIKVGLELFIIETENPEIIALLSWIFLYVDPFSWTLYISNTIVDWMLDYQLDSQTITNFGIVLKSSEFLGQISCKKLGDIALKYRQNSYFFHIREILRDKPQIRTTAINTLNDRLLDDQLLVISSFLESDSTLKNETKSTKKNRFHIHSELSQTTNSHRLFKLCLHIKYESKQLL
jgi:hypothetical protein